MTLNEQERHSALWVKLAAHMRERLGVLRSKNDGALDPLPTATLRGQIKTLKELLALEVPGPAHVAPDD